MRLADQEPRLLVLMNAIDVARERLKGKRYGYSNAWYGVGCNGFKQQLCRLVGWDSSEPLRTPEAYDIAYEYLYLRLCKGSGVPV